MFQRSPALPGRRVGLILAAFGLIAFAPARADEFSAAQKAEIESVVKSYLLKNPEVIRDAAEALQEHEKQAETTARQQIIGDPGSKLFDVANQAVIGNPSGAITLVEFFDYNCGYCKRAMTDMLDLMKTDPKLKVVLKEFPVLSPGSVEAAQVAVAVRMQDPGGKKYLDFHQKLLGGRGPADKARAMAAAKDAGLDTARLEKDLANPEVKATIEENFKLAEAMGMNGTPSYVIGKQIVVGAVGLDGLKEKIALARCGKETC